RTGPARCGLKGWGLGGEAAKRRQAPNAADRAPPGLHSMKPASPALEAVFAEHRPFLWSLCYRLCGDAADVVQETFVRALQHPPRRTDAPWRPWLVKVALNLGRDLLRRRRRRGYVGPWLPAPVDEP